MLIDEQNIVLETGVQMWLETELDHDWIVVTIDVRVYSVEALEKLPDQGGKSSRKWDTLSNVIIHSNVALVSQLLPILLGNICSLSILL